MHGAFFFGKTKKNGGCIPARRGRAAPTPAPWATPPHPNFPGGVFSLFSIAHFHRKCYTNKIYWYVFRCEGALRMNNKKLSRLLEPNLKLYFFCLLVFSAAAVTVS